MLITFLLACFSSPVPFASLPEGEWSCRGEKTYYCESATHPSIGIRLFQTKKKDTPTNPSLHQCEHTVAHCTENREPIGDIPSISRTYLYQNMAYTIETRGNRGQSLEALDATVALFDQIRFHDLEKACLAKTGKPCTITFPK